MCDIIILQALCFFTAFRDSSRKIHKYGKNERVSVMSEYTNIKEYAKEHFDGVVSLLRDLCLIPAPSHFEHDRAEFCRAWLEGVGASGVYTDDALNVVFPINCENSNEITVVVAHTDTVFPDTQAMPYSDDGEKIFCPGVGDDTASLAVMLFVAKYFIENKISPEKGILFVCNSCEEGLGNLKGTRQIFCDYEGRIAQFVSFDSKISVIVDRCVGSHRYEVEALTEGGHSYARFGAPNAIAELAKVISSIYSIDVPTRVGTKTTYNVGIVEGGTSVNTIAQSAKMLCEYRSTDLDCLAFMEKEFNRIFAESRESGVDLRVTRVGERPCMGDVDLQKIERMASICAEVVENVTGSAVHRASGSTDCNIPLSLGIPALCIGVYTGGGSHTREEWIEKASLIPGLEIGIQSIIKLSEDF